MPHLTDGDLHAHLDGEGSPQSRRVVEEHLAGCAACRTRLDEAREERRAAEATLATLSPERVEGPPFGAILRSRERGVTTSGARRARAVAGIGAAWAASIVLALGLGWAGHGAWEGEEMPGPSGGIAERTSEPGEETPPATRSERGLGYAVQERAADTAEFRARRAPVTLSMRSPEHQYSSVEAYQVWHDLSGREGEADDRGLWQPASPAVAHRSLGWAPMGPEGVPWESMEMAIVEGRPIVRTRHPLPGGGTLDLIQGPWGRDEEGAESRGAESEESDAPFEDPAILPFPTEAGPRVASSMLGADVGIVMGGPLEIEELEELVRRLR